VSWTEAGAGPSLYVPRPAFQSAVASVVGSARGVPDVAVDANPETGAWIRLSGSWYIFGGTSLASPLMAAITNAAGHFAVSTAAELTALYANLGTAKFNDIQRGTCGQYQGLAAGTGYDLCTGIGSPAGLTGE
jgi:subtilase family serine protease